MRKQKRPRRPRVVVEVRRARERLTRLLREYLRRPMRVQHV